MPVFGANAKAAFDFGGNSHAAAATTKTDKVSFNSIGFQPISSDGEFLFGAQTSSQSVIKTETTNIEPSPPAGFHFALSGVDIETAVAGGFHLSSGSQTSTQSVTKTEITKTEPSLSTSFHFGSSGGDIKPPVAGGFERESAKPASVNGKYNLFITVFIYCCFLLQMRCLNFCFTYIYIYISYIIYIYFIYIYIYILYTLYIYIYLYTLYIYI